MKPLVRISVPERFQSDNFMKTASDFDVPNTRDGHDFMAWWEKAKRSDRDGIMKVAFDNNVSIVDAFKKVYPKES